MGGTSRQTRLFTIDPPGATSEHVPRTLGVIIVMFIAFLLISSIVAAKVTALDAGLIRLVFSGGAILFPLTYVLGDILLEAYGSVRAKRVIILGFIMSVLTSLTFLLVQIIPIGLGYEDQTALEAVLGFVPRIAAASVVGCLVE